MQLPTEVGSWNIGTCDLHSQQHPRLAVSRDGANITEGSCLVKAQYKGGLGDASKLMGVRKVAGGLPDLSNVVLSPVVLEDLQGKIPEIDKERKIHFASFTVCLSWYHTQL